MLLQDPPSTVLPPSGSDLGVSQRLLGPTSHFIPSGFPREPVAVKSTADMGLHGHGSPATGLSTQKIMGLPGCGPEQHLSASGGERCPSATFSSSFSQAPTHTAHVPGFIMKKGTSFSSLCITLLTIPPPLRKRSGHFQIQPHVMTWTATVCAISRWGNRDSKIVTPSPLNNDPQKNLLGTLGKAEETR